MERTMKRALSSIVLLAALPILLLGTSLSSSSLVGTWRSQDGSRLLNLHENGSFSLQSGRGRQCKGGFVTNTVEKGTYQMAGATGGSLRLETDCPKSGPLATFSRAGDKLLLTYREGTTITFERIPSPPR
jgi:hypothetical protein